MSRSRCAWPALCLALSSLYAASAGAADLPVPPDATGVGPAADMVLGEQPIKAQEFVSKLSVEQVRAFYERELPKRGWTLRALPWMAQMEAMHGKLAEELKRRPELRDDPATAGQIAMAQRGYEMLNAHMRGALYAGQDAHRLLLNFHQEEEGTVISVSRWDETATIGETFAGRPVSQAPSAPLGSATGAPSWPEANPCCSGAAVPPSLRQLPSSVPQYPTGRMVSTGAVPTLAGVQQAATELYLTTDTADAVSVFYTEHMGYNGWAPVELPGAAVSDAEQLAASQGLPMASRFLAFKNSGGGMCTVTISSFTGLPKDARSQLSPELLEQNPMMGELLNAEGPGGAPAERTVITVSYLELKAPPAPRAPFGRQGHGPAR